MQENTQNRMPLIGDKAPQFRATTTMGEINFPEDKSGKWTVLFSHPADFTPVCTTEFMGFQDLKEEFDKINTDLLGYSVDGIHSHIEWVKNIKKTFDVDIEFPIVAGIDVAQKYGMLHSGSSNATVRATFLINPDGVIEAILYYPMSNGRDIKEILRLTKALQKTYSDKVATPESWPNNTRTESDVIIPPALSIEESVANENNPNYKCYDWYMCTKKNN